MSAEQGLQMHVVNGSDGRCLVAVRLIVGVRYLERPLREVLLYNRRAERAPHLSYSGEKSSSYIYICFLYIYIYIYVRTSCTRALRANVGPAG